eukprot:TRINITY_DN12790_c0_g1_i1.p1 TRINITY_DN12790_c0_g1~~TRINITY_DN12790_c0_g1_i1.p1  ORF type:complete len:256 (-),score=20.07 TRINITY_DN12790_c0_g1_i1:257-1024(-)
MALDAVAPTPLQEVSGEKDAPRRKGVDYEQVSAGEQPDDSSWRDILDESTPVSSLGTREMLERLYRVNHMLLQTPRRRRRKSMKLLICELESHIDTLTSARTSGGSVSTEVSCEESDSTRLSASTAPCTAAEPAEPPRCVFGQSESPRGCDEEQTSERARCIFGQSETDSTALDTSETDVSISSSSCATWPGLRVEWSPRATDRGSSQRQSKNVKNPEQGWNPGWLKSQMAKRKKRPSRKKPTSFKQGSTVDPQL